MSYMILKKKGDYSLEILVDDIEKFTELIKSNRLDDEIMRIKTDFTLFQESNI